MSNAARVLFSPESEADCFLPEGPRSVVVENRSALAWVNIQTAADATAGTIHLHFWDTGERRTLSQAARPGFLLPTDRPGVVLVGREKEIGTLDVATNAWSALATIPDIDVRTIINDGECVPGGGAVVFGTKDTRFAEPIAHLYLFTLADCRATVLADQQLCSNGKVFARDGDGLILYDIDTPTRVVQRYRIDLGRRTAAADGVAVDLRSWPGLPDGMTDCGDGTVIVAMYNPDPVPDGHAYRFDLRTGAMIEEWIVPGSPRVTCPLLVEHDGRVQLVLTTAVEGMPPEQRRHCPDAGGLFIAETSFARAPQPEPVRLIE